MLLLYYIYRIHEERCEIIFWASHILGAVFRVHHSVSGRKRRSKTESHTLGTRSAKDQIKKIENCKKDWRGIDSVHVFTLYDTIAYQLSPP